MRPFRLLDVLLYLAYLNLALSATCHPISSSVVTKGRGTRALTYDETDTLHFPYCGLTDGAGLGSYALQDIECIHDDIACMLRGGAKKLTKTKASKKKRVEEVEESSKSEEKEEEGAVRYIPSKKKGILEISFNFIYGQVYGIIAPFLPRSVSKKLRLNPSRSSSSTISAKKGEKVSRLQLTQEHLEKSFTKGDSNARIQKELRSFLANPPDNCKLIVGSNMRNWVVQITGADGTIYAGEKYKLRILFPKEYPTKPPSVYFLKPTPRHVHVYSNGDICLNLLGKDWRPQMSAQLLVVSILSMLSSAKEKKIPPDNAMHADNAPGQQQTSWMYHDDRT